MRALICLSLLLLALPGVAHAQLELAPLPGPAVVDAARAGDRVVFATTDGALWQTDGHATTRLRDGLEPQGLSGGGEHAYFVGADNTLHRTDGVRTDPVAAGIAHGSFAGLTTVNGAFVFLARPAGDDGSNTLWRTDGTAAGTRSMGVYTWAWIPEVAAVSDTTLLVKTRYFLYRTDGHTAVEEGGTRDAAAIPGGFLTRGTGEDGRAELFRLDASGTNPQPVAPIDSPRWFARLDERVLFQGDASTSEPRWYSTDLTGGDIQPLPTLRASTPPHVAAGRAFLTGYENEQAVLSRTDGTEGGTVELGRFAADPAGFTAFAGRVWFTAGGLWSTDGTAAGTRRETEAPAANLVATDEALFFSSAGAPWAVRRPAPPATEEEEEPAQDPPLPPSTPATPAQPGPPQPHVTLLETPPARGASVHVQAKRLRTVRGVRRWRITGTVRDTGCSGRVRIELAGVKTVTARVRRCRFSATISTRKRARSVAVRTVPSATLGTARSQTLRLR